MNIIGLDHIVLRSAQQAELINFYCNDLGCTIEREEPTLGLTQLRAGQHLIDVVDVNSPLGKQGGATHTGSDNNLDHFCLQVTAASEQVLIDELQAKNIDTSTFERRYGSDGFGRSIYIRDPDRNTVELRLV